MLDEQKKAEFVQLYAQLSPADRERVHEYVDALKAGDAEKIERLWREAHSRGKEDSE